MNERCDADGRFAVRLLAQHQLLLNLTDGVGELLLLLLLLLLLIVVVIVVVDVAP